MPKSTIDIYQKIANFDLFISIGTSGNVYPAAGFLEVAKDSGADTLCINMEEIVQQTNVYFFFKGIASKGLEIL
jgi:NAD-dependent deacetylase